ncbi:hypothetical protein CRENPOLYSF2_3600002 [Crenothrix polyspora]|uniref:Uncharacterized protein n=1 Tax=Crenothrix polyspora TaxID=360316 RepID=A0A1R4HC87_9GAMM|nr:hypothetical protein CRENPOLYSF2_3600002 [Crenothrix polyspora]
MIINKGIYLMLARMELYQNTEGAVKSLITQATSGLLIKISAYFLGGVKVYFRRC